MALSIDKSLQKPWELARFILIDALSRIEKAINLIPPPARFPTLSVRIPSGPTPAINSDLTDLAFISPLTQDVKSFSMNLSGDPVEGQKLLIRLLDNGTPRLLSWGSSFKSRGATLPTTTTANKYTYVTCYWNAVSSTWDAVSVSQEA